MKKKKNKIIACKPIKIEITRYIEQEEVKDGCINHFKDWSFTMDDGRVTTLYSTTDRGKILLDILEAMVR